ncbi:4-hydroxy-tetrahydrodipicolinate synthase [Pelosinus fermentans]|jgi:4-hydroxy-tetrahydrodipicolinate synthase|uniref:4-hydroxy-tetrahydrodipicolinate synthase n=1 Tax=Pelosinus fermentans TaxID=365349 RepID=UPI00026852ED|nr:4-hydroxy-tetrahydrodipicolinate synthase [Pelosinus fermentans]OAM96328.1 Dihydrodipicolinate synthase [Pelosinus fermentans DSM 17108]SDR38931.1 4-hydroxy-tetrahydrodipicolinate synthase [Pelosinus fermentans]
MEVKGIITAMVTPFDENQGINADATRQLVNTLIHSGVSGLFILGTNGEFHLLTNDEKIAFAKIVIDEVNKRVPVYVGTGGNSTSEVMELSKKMEALGADALSVITPYFLVPSQNEIIQHYKAIAEAVRIPIVLYNIPKNTGINLEPETVRQLAKIKNIIAIKDSSGKLENIEKYIQITKDEDFSVLSGSDSLILSALKIGAAGAIAATSNLITAIDVSIYENFLKGDMEKAEKAQQDIEVLRAVLKLGTVPSILKKAMEMIGIPVGPARLPVTEVKEETVKKIGEMLDYYKV